MSTTVEIILPKYAHKRVRCTVQYKGTTSEGEVWMPEAKTVDGVETKDIGEVLERETLFTGLVHGSARILIEEVE